jgi:hypothetical protein
VQQRRGDDLVLEPAAVEELGDLERVQDERREVGGAALPGVELDGVGEGGPGDGQRLEERRRSGRPTASA